MKSNPISLNMNYRPQLLVGLILGIWLYLFLVLVGPFDAGELSISIRSFLMLGYGLVFILSYALLIPIQNKLYLYWGRWTLGYEIAMVLLFCCYCLPICFAYYKTGLVNGNYSFISFLLRIYLPIIAIVIPVIFGGRYLISQNENKDKNRPNLEKMVTLFGDNKLDILKIPFSNLVAFEAANNYVAVHYLQNGQIQKKLLRSSLRKLQESGPEMTQVHRSYIVNMKHFIEWKDGLTLVMTQFTVPVSQKYKSTILDIQEFTPK